MAPLTQQTGGNGAGLTNQQIATLLNLLAQTPQANPSSPSFNPNVFSSLYNTSNQSAIANALQQQPLQQNSINYTIVRSVNDPSEIGPQEVTMGVLNVFPSFSGDKIFVKSWNKEGLIENNVFVLQKEAEKSLNPMNEDFTALEKRVKALETALAKMKKQKSAKVSTQKPSVKKQEQPSVEEIVKEDPNDE